MGRDPPWQFAADRAKQERKLNWYLVQLAAAAFITFNLFGLGGDSVNFDNQKPGRPPGGWSLAETRGPQASRWEVRQDSTAPSRPNVLQQLSSNGPESEAQLAIFDKTACRDGELSVKFKIATGPRRTRDAGIVWRYQDPRNYYLLRFSVEERTIGVFRVQDGQVHAVPGEVRHELRTGEWYAAKVVFKGTHFRVFFGNRQLFDADDDTASGPGKMGLWTKAGTVVSFDDFRIEKKV